jgi:hypothetical protein
MRRKGKFFLPIVLPTVLVSSPPLEFKINPFVFNGLCGGLKFLGE